MASVLDSIRTVFGSKNSILKLMAISTICSYPLFQTISNFQGWTSMWSLIAYAAVIFYIGYILLSSHNLINEVPNLLPPFFNPFKIFFVGIGGLIVLTPIVALMAYVGYCLYQIFANIGFPLAANYAAVILVELLFFGILTVQMTLFTTNLNPLASYNLIKIFKTFLDFAFKAIPLIIVLFIFTAIVLYPLGYLSYQMFGLDSYPFLLIVATFITFLVVVAVQFYSQLAMENIVLCRKVEYEDDAGSVKDRDLLVDRDKYSNDI